MPQVPASRSFLVSGQRNRGFSPQGFYGPMNLNRCAGDATTYDSAVTQPASAGLGHCCAAPPGCWTPSGAPELVLVLSSDAAGECRHLAQLCRSWIRSEA